MAQGLALAPLLHLHVLQLLLWHHGPTGGGLDAALLAGGGLAGGQLVFHRHHAGAEAVALLLLPTGATDAKFFQQTTAQLLELFIGPLIDNDPIWAAAHQFRHRQLPGAQHPFSQQRHAEGTNHQAGKFASFNIKTKAKNPAQYIASLGDHLAIDHLAIALRIEGLHQGIGRIHQNHIAHLADPIQGHPARQARQKAGERVVPQAEGHHLPPIDVHHHLPHHPQAAARIAGDHLGSHQLRAQPEPIAGGG